MPRASQYLLEGYTYHLTHRCHGGEFLLRHRRDRARYREWLRTGVRRFKVPVFGYSITRNHVHIIAHASTREAVGSLMHLASGSVAKSYNVRMHRRDSMWEHPYRCTVVQDGQHLLNCLRYVDFNMVRAGEVKHPADWPVCGYHELVGRRQRYRLLDVAGLAERVGFGSVTEFQRWYADSIEQRLAKGNHRRESCWTDALAVGDSDFVTGITDKYSRRWMFAFGQTSTGGWFVQEEREPYGTQEG